jgi:hypothetical protein
LDLSKPVFAKALAAEVFLRTFSNDPAIRMPPDGQLSDEERGELLRWSEQVLKSK